MAQESTLTHAGVHTWIHSKDSGRQDNTTHVFLVKTNTEGQTPHDLETNQRI